MIRFRTLVSYDFVQDLMDVLRLHTSLDKVLRRSALDQAAEIEGIVGLTKTQWLDLGSTLHGSITVGAATDLNLVSNSAQNPRLPVLEPARGNAASRLFTTHRDLAATIRAAASAASRRSVRQHGLLDILPFKLPCRDGKLSLGETRLA